MCVQQLFFAIFITLFNVSLLVQAELNYAINDMGNNQLQKSSSVLPSANPYTFPYYPYQAFLQAYQQPAAIINKPAATSPQENQSTQKSPYEVDLGEVLAQKVAQVNTSEQQPQLFKQQQLMSFPAMPPIPGLTPFHLPVPPQLPPRM